MNCLQNNRTLAGSRGNLVYLTKVFYDAEENSSPILTPLTTTATAFTQQLSIGQSACRQPSCGCKGASCPAGCYTPGCGDYGGCEREVSGCGACASGCGACGGRACQNACDVCQIVCCCCGGNDGCSNVTVGAGTTFDVNKAYVITRSFDITTPTLPADLAVTVDGNAITDVTQSGGQYAGDVSGIMPEITKCPCSAGQSGCPGRFVMVSATGPWSLTATIVLEGTLYDGGNACHFRLCYTTADGTPISVAGNPSFAICGAEIPCQMANVAPSLLFDFGACASILNPVLTAAEGGAITLSGSLVVTPQVRMRVIRPSLFNLNAQEICLPCDDLGQCNPCDPCEENCFPAAADCCCGQPSVNRVDEITFADSACPVAHPSACPAERQGCGPECGCGGAAVTSGSDNCGCANDNLIQPRRQNGGNFREITCQCCDTNGYSF